MHRRFQFSLKTLLVATMAICLFCGYQVNRARRQREAVAKIEKSGGLALYGYEWDQDQDRSKSAPLLEPGPAWLRNLLGIDYLDSVVAIEAQECEMTDSDFVWLLDRLPNVSYLELRMNPIGDASMPKVGTMRNLTTLRLARTDITDSGLRDIGRNKSLRSLDLCGDRVTDTGLLALSGLTELRSLYIEMTDVTDSGVSELKKVLPRVKKRRY